MSAPGIALKITIKLNDMSKRTIAEMASHSQLRLRGFCQTSSMHSYRIHDSISLGKNLKDTLVVFYIIKTEFAASPVL